MQAGAAKVTLIPRDSFRQRVYLAPLGLWLTLDAGRFERVELDPKTGSVRLTLEASDKSTPVARLRIEQPAAVQGVGKYATVKRFAFERNASVIPLGAAATLADLSGGRR